MLNKKIIVVMILTVFLIGCRTAPIADISNAPVTTGSGKVPALSAVTHDIIQAGIGLGWQMKKMKPGYIVGTLHLRKHMVQVNIHYSSSAYSITYSNSQEMHYDGSKIHPNYNAWVHNLDNAIRQQVFNNN